jgi:hypothetical protein
LLNLDAERAIPVEGGSYRWRGELRSCDNEALMVWYRSTDAAGTAVALVFQRRSDGCPG